MGQSAGGLRVDADRILGVGLAPIDIGGGGAVNDPGRADEIEQARGGKGIGQVARDGEDSGEGNGVIAVDGGWIVSEGQY